MDVRELKKQLERIDENLEVLICTKASKNYMGIDFVTDSNSSAIISLIDLDFSLDEKGLAQIEKEKEELFEEDYKLQY